MNEKCQVCGRRKTLISRSLAVCIDCLRRGDPAACNLALVAHARARMEFNLPFQPVHQMTGRSCTLCSHECQIGEDQYGFCGFTHGSIWSALAIATSWDGSGGEGKVSRNVGIMLKLKKQRIGGRRASDPRRRRETLSSKSAAIRVVNDQCLIS